MEGIDSKVAAERKKTIQQEFLDTITKSSEPVTVFLVNGVRLQGSLDCHDDECILLQGRDQCQLVYKHAISTVLPCKRPVERAD